jgi:2-octaprenyl-6-methoxyphenol hydroxylase
VVLEAQTQPAQDARTLALSYNSRLIFDRLGVWQKLTQVVAIEKVHVSQRGSFPAANLEASDLGLPALGYTVNFGELRQALESSLAEGSITILKGAEVVQRESVSEKARASFNFDGAQHEATANLIAIADGKAGSDARTHDYGSTAIVTEVRAEIAPGVTAFERFAANGAIALLPKADSWALIWSAPTAHAEELLAASGDVFLRELQQNFGDRLRRFIEVKRRASFPLVSRTTRTVIEPRMVRLGNSAQALHPVMAQGLNLGLRDAFQLGREIAAAHRKDIGSERMLASYRARRARDRSAATAASDFAARLFSFDFAPARLTTALGLATLSALPSAKRLFLHRAIFGG